MGFPGEFFGDFFSGISLTYEPSDPVKRTSILFTSQYVAVDPLLITGQEKVFGMKQWL